MLDVMDLGSPVLDVYPGARGKLLATLAQLETPVTARSLARHAGVSPQTALDVVDDLSEAGVVQVRRTGGLALVMLNREHVLAEPVVMLARARGRLIQRLSGDLAGWRGLAAAWLFGSAARGDGDRDSDIDLFLVAETAVDDAGWAAAIGRLAERVHAWTGNHAEIIEHPWGSFVRLVREDNALIAAIRADGIALTPDSRGRLRDAA
jgi:predicted nucleotidyltransferase